MKNQFIFRILALVALFGLITLEISAQTSGKIVGKVTDEKNGEVLIGLNVKVLELKRGATTGVDGRFVISGLATGKYTVELSYVGYQTKKIADVEVKSGQVQTLNVVMSEGTSQKLKEVVITSSVKKESTAGLYATQKNAAVVSDGVSADAIRKSPDKNTGEVLKRVSGATIQDNKFVVVRGLNDRYNNATLDNGALPSTEPNRKAFSFDIVPANLVDAIVIKKTASPDMAADFAGGSVSIITKDIPDSYFVSFGGGYSYNSQTTFKNFYGNQLNAGTYFGIANASQLPSSFPSREAAVNLGYTNSAPYINSISNNWNVNNYNSLPGQNYQLSVGNVRDFSGGQRLGAVVSFTYRNSENTRPDSYKNWNDYQDYHDQIYKLTTSIGSLVNIGYTYGTNKITLKTLYNLNYDNQYLQRNGFFIGSGRYIQYYAMDEMQKSLFKTTLEGEHKLGEKQSKIKWTAAYSHVGNNQPDQRKVNYQLLDGVYYANLTTIGKDNARMFSDLGENILSGDVAYSLPVKLFKEDAIFKTGAGSQYRNRNYNSRFVGLQLNNNDAAVGNEIASRSLENLYSADLVNGNYYRLQDITIAADIYDAYSITNNAYAMLDNKIGKHLRAVWGVRAEQYIVNLTSSDNSSKEVNHNWIDILPSANLSYALTNKANLRLSASKTLARPELREMARASYYDYENLVLLSGNENLDRTHITNTDLRWEFYPSNGQVLSVSAFYKHFQNPIEPTLNDQNSSMDASFDNSYSAYVYGAELEFRKNLDFIASNKFFKNTSLYSNLSLMKSDVEVKLTDETIHNRPLVGQSPYVINAGLQHSALSSKLNVSVLYNKIGRRITRVGGQNFADVWEDPRDLLDLQLGYRVIKRRGEIKLNVSDFLNQRYVQYFDDDNNKKYTSGSDATFSRYNPGTNVSLSFSYSLR